jgi:hypothetical protein
MMFGCGQLYMGHCWFRTGRGCPPRSNDATASAVGRGGGSSSASAMQWSLVPGASLEMVATTRALSMEADSHHGCRLTPLSIQSCSILKRMKSGHIMPRHWRSSTFITYEFSRYRKHLIRTHFPMDSLINLSAKLDLTL